jgi:hypothetical protein
MNHYFTFGQAHISTKGVSMKDYWVRVIASNAEEAREKFIKNFTSIYMRNENQWSFQYAEKAFNPSFFPKGEYRLIE